jgi:hypothetical protein
MRDSTDRLAFGDSSIKCDEYNGHEYLKLRAFCYLRNEERFFNVEKLPAISCWFWVLRS